MKKNPYIHLVKTAWKFSKGRRKHFLWGYIALLFANSLLLLEPLVIGQIMNVLQEGGENVLKNVLPWIFLLPAIDVVFWCFHGPARVSERMNGFFASQKYTESMFQMVTELPMSWHRDHHSGESYDKIAKAKSALQEFIDEGFMYIETIIRLVVASIAILLFLPYYGGLVFVVGAVVIATIRIFDKKIISLQQKVNTLENHVASGLFDYVSNIATVITLRLEKLSKSEISRRIMKIMIPFKKNVFVNEYKWFSTGLMVRLGTLSLLVLYIYQESTTVGTIMVGSAVALYQYIQQLNSAFFNFGWQWEMIVTKSTDIKSAESIGLAHQKYKKKLPSTNKKKEWDFVEVKNLHFLYEDDHHFKHHLKNIHIELAKGLKIALVGESGSGKSTLMKLLRGLDKPNSVEVVVDGEYQKSLEVVSMDSTLLPQDPEIFENTIEYNITLGIKHKKSELDEAIKLAQFKKVCDRLPNGVKTNIKEKGVNLSGGEKQRLALARGIFTIGKNSILLLDEPTSSVDPTNERKIYRNLFKKFPEKCVVSSIHRLHLLPLFDVIYVLDKGELKEVGSFEELKKKNEGVLQKMWAEYLGQQKKPQK